VDVSFRAADIMSEGTRMAAELFAPRNPKADRLPTVVMSHGWGGSAAALRPDAIRFAQAGYLVVAFDYRGWGNSDSRLVAVGKPEQKDGKLVAEVKEVREVVDPIDQTTDILNAISWVTGDKQCDKERIGIWGSSFSGGHVVYVAARDPRVKAFVSQVGSMDGRWVLSPKLKDYTFSQAAARTRGQIGYPRPREKFGTLTGAPVLEKFVGYAPIEDIGRCKDCDADHSFASCLHDFQAYRRFLGEGSVVTLHDTNLAGAGVRHVVEYIRTLADCDVVDFPEVGERTALVRIGKTARGSWFRPAPRSGAPAASPPIPVVRRSGAAPVTPAGKGWKYLESPAFASRYVLAAHHVRACPLVIEIGGSATSIDQFLTGDHESVLVLDPFLRESYADSLRGRPCRVARVRARFQDVDWHVPPEAAYGLVMLGLEIQRMEPHQYEVLYRLVTGAPVTVIEFPPSGPPSREQFEPIRRNTRTRLTFQARLDLEGNDFGDLSNSWPPRCDRALYVLEPV
jgi:dienelactone hydrolase